MGLAHLEKENAELKKELHRLRKVEASFLGGKKTKVIERVHKENHHYIDEKNKLEREFKTLHTEKQELIRQIQALETENKELRDRNSYLEQENKTLVLKNNDLVGLNAK
jgi:cell division protein FtsB